MVKEISKLKNNIDYIYKKNENTPRMAVCLAFSVNNPEKQAGIYSLIPRLLLQGTKKYNSEELANELEKYAIDLSAELIANYLRIRFVCLNEDFSKAIELMEDVIKNSTFEEFEKERAKLVGEISADLDSPKTIVMDKYARTLFGDHYYGNTVTKVLENIKNVTREDVIEAYHNILNNSKKSLAIVGALGSESVMAQVESSLGDLPESVDGHSNIEKPEEVTEVKKIETIRANLNQAHILKGWSVPTYGEEDYPALILLNIILGSCGLSSRLFLELRDKKGLAYVVRSTYETYKLAGNFMIYIATEPKNIDVSLEGFNAEIEKIKTIPVSEKELNDAKNNFVGKCAFVNETNMQQACIYAKNSVLGFGFDYSDKVKELVQAVTSEQILACAQKYFNDKYVVSIVKP